MFELPHQHHSGGVSHLDYPDASYRRRFWLGDNSARLPAQKNGGGTEPQQIPLPHRRQRCDAMCEIVSHNKCEGLLRGKRGAAAGRQLNGYVVEKSSTVLWLLTTAQLKVLLKMFTFM